MNYSFGKNICAELVNTSGAAEEWLITDEFSTDLDEMGIFVLSKDQIFRTCATFLDPAKFSILVIHLILEKIKFKALCFKMLNVSGLKSGRLQMVLRKNYWELLATLVYNVWKLDDHAS